MARMMVKFFLRILAIGLAGQVLISCTMTARVTDLAGKIAGGGPVSSNSNLPKVSFEDSAIVVDEGNSISVNVNLNKALTQDVQVSVSIVNGATGERLNPLPTLLIIPAGFTSVALLLNTIDDTLIQNADSIQIVLSPVDNSIQVTSGTLVATVNDNDGGNPAAPPPTPNAPILLSDLNTNPAVLKSYLVNGKIVYLGVDLLHGEELWVSDGTTLGTRLLKDIIPGVASPKISDFMLNQQKTLLYFVATTPAEGTELWITDGTELGTNIVADLEPGAAGSDPTLVVSSLEKLYFYANISADPWGRRMFIFNEQTMSHTLLNDITYVNFVNDFYEFNGYTYLAIEGLESEMWKTDGSNAGTTLASRGTPADDFMAAPKNIVRLGNKLIFEAADWTVFYEPFSYDTVTGATSLLKNIGNGNFSSRPVFSELTLNGKIIFFVQFDSSPSNGFYLTDGTSANTAKVVAAATPSAFFGKIGNEVIFSSGNSPEGMELWKTDGTPGGTVLLKDIHPGSTGSNVNNSSPEFATQIGSKILFTAKSPTEGKELWVTDGSTAGTVLLKDINVGSESSSPSNFIQVGSKVFFTAVSSDKGHEIWETDGTPAGTKIFNDYNPGAKSSGPVSLTQLSTDKIFFGAYNISNKMATAHIANLSNSQISGIGHALIESLGSNTSSFHLFNGSVFFRAMDSSFSNQLWKTDGTFASTVKIKDINPNVNCTDIGGMMTFNGSLFFAGTGTQGKEVYISDGSSAGTTILKDINSGSGSGLSSHFFLPSMDMLTFTPAGSQFFFSADDGSTGQELWVSDGTSAGTQLVKNIYTGTTVQNGVTSNNNGNPYLITRIGNTSNVIFSSTNGSGTSGIYISDGTSANTNSIGLSGIFSVNTILQVSPEKFIIDYSTSSFKKRIAGFNYTTSSVYDLFPSYNSNNNQSSSFYIPRIGKLFWITEETPSFNSFIRVSDGTLAGTGVLVSGPTSSNSFQSIFDTGSDLLYIKGDIGSYKIFKTNGAIGNAGTEIASTANKPTFLKSIGNKLILSLSTAPEGEEIYSLDLTTGTIILLKDIYPGPTSSVNLNTISTVANGKVYFTATDGVHGMELWVTDGTPAGTELVSDINPGTDSSNPTNFTLLDGKLYFQAEKILTGIEIWVLTP